MSAGIKNIFDETHLTDRKLYRSEVAAADSNPDSASLPVINLHLDTSGVAALRTNDTPVKYDAVTPTEASVKFPGARRGYNAQVALFAIVQGSNPSADISVWVWGGLEPFPSVRASLTGKWCLVQTTTITKNSLIMVRDIPSAPVVVTVSAISGSGAKVTIHEQHTE